MRSAQLDRDLLELTTAAAPGLMTKFGVGVDVTAQLLATAGDNLERLRSDASFAHLTGTARSRGPRVNEPGTGSTAAGTGPPTTRFIQSPWCECATASAPVPTCSGAPTRGLSKREIIRCLKPAIVRETFLLGLETLARSRAVLTATTDTKEDAPTLIGAPSA
jgi:transposase